MKKTLAFLITIILFEIQEISAQNYLNYYQTINKAEIANLDKEFKKSDSLYQVAFGLVDKPYKEDYLLASINSEKLKNDQKTYEYLKNGIGNGLTLKRIKKNILEFKKSKYWKKLKREYDSLYKTHLQSLNIPLRNEIIEMVKHDQKIRNPIFGNSYKLTSNATKDFLRLLKIIKENNNKWPGFSTIGEITPKGKYNVTDNIVLILLHLKKKQIEELKPFLLEAVLNGEMYPYHFARVIDYKDIVNCQIYGTYKYNSKYDIGKICDCETANNERSEIGFETIEDFYRKIKSEYKCQTKK